MAKHFIITIEVAFDEATLPKDPKRILELNLDEAIQRGLFAGFGLTAGGMAEVEEYSAEVEELQNERTTIPD